MAGKVRIVNRDKDRKFFETPRLNERGEEVRDARGIIIMEKIILGSTEDAGDVKCAQPEIDIDGDLWDRLCKQKTVRGLVDTRAIAVYPMAA